MQTLILVRASRLEVCRQWLCSDLAVQTDIVVRDSRLEVCRLVIRASCLEVCRLIVSRASCPEMYRQCLCSD